MEDYLASDRRTTPPPRSEPTPQAARSDVPPAQATPDRAGSDVLIVDDLVTGQSLVRAILEPLGIGIRAVPGVAPALAALRVRRPALVLCDVHLAGESGFDLLRELKDPRAHLQMNATVLHAVRDRSLQIQEELDNRSKPGSNVDQVGWVTLLNSASALQMYRQVQHVTTPAAVSEFLLLNRDFPRSILRCVRRADESLHSITGSSPGAFKNESQRLLGRLRSELDFANIDEIMAHGLHQYVDALQQQLNDVGGAVQKQFFEL